MKKLKISFITIFCIILFILVPIKTNAKTIYNNSLPKESYVNSVIFGKIIQPYRIKNGFPFKNRILELVGDIYE